MRSEWKDRLEHWVSVLAKELYEPLGEIVLEGFCTYELLDEKTAESMNYQPMPVGTAWGHNWEYCWLRGDITVDARGAGQRIVMDLRLGGESTLFVDGEVFGTRRAEWVEVPHHHICDQVLTTQAMEGQQFHLLMESYAGHSWPGSQIGPWRGEADDYHERSDEEVVTKIGKSTWGIWHEDAYQLWLDVTTLQSLLEGIDADSLRAARVEEALERFTLLVDYEQPRSARKQDYARAREALRPLLEAVNGSTMPEFTAVGNAHLDLSWLWPYRETQRKVARTFAQQVRLMDLYPEYRFIQSQPDSYLTCKQLYPKLYERIQEKIRAGQWIADGSMWVEPDTNMTSGESLVRQLVHGKRFYREEFGVDTQMLWLPDTFGYSAALPQILKGAGVKYLTTQKIFWTYNDSDRFPYHYFTWQGMDGSEVTSFLHMDYTSKTDPNTIIGRWRDRVQRRDLDKFLLPYGYGDGGGGPTRDHIEYVQRQKDLEGSPRVKQDAPQHFFEEMAQQGAPKNRYVGELYFQCHRGTYTSQAAIKKGNRKSEFALREAEIWSVAAQDQVTYPLQTLDAAWKQVLLNQFHDILPGSSIARVYEEAKQRYAQVAQMTDEVIAQAIHAIAKGEGLTWFNSLSWERKQVVKTEEGIGVVTVPAMGWTSAVDYAVPQMPVRVLTEGECLVMDNGLMRVTINPMGEVISCRDAQGRERISGKANVLHMYKDTPRKYDAWDVDSMYDQSPVDLAESGQITNVLDTPWFAEVTVTRQVGNSQWEQTIRMEVGKTMLRFDTKVDWHEHHRLLKVAFPTGIHAEESINEIQYGFVRRPTHRSRPYDADRFEVCNHRYTALCDENRGAAVLNDCKYGVSMLGDEIALTLLRGAMAPDLNADQGEHQFSYAYIFWDGSWMDSGVVRDGYELNAPLTAAVGQMDDFSMMSVEAPNVIIDTVKAAEDGSGDVIVRLYEAKHAQTDTYLRVNLPVTSASLVNLLEEEEEPVEMDGGMIALHFRGFEVKTVRLHR